MRMLFIFCMFSPQISPPSLASAGMHHGHVLAFFDHQAPAFRAPVQLSRGGCWSCRGGKCRCYTAGAQCSFNFNHIFSPRY